MVYAFIDIHPIFIIDAAVAGERGRIDRIMRSPEMTYVKRMMFECRHVWRRTTIRPVYFGRKVFACVALAENTSERAMQLPSQENINAMKLVLQTDEEPKWYKYYG